MKMSDWTDVIREKILQKQEPLPEEDWDWFEANLLIPMMRKRKRARLIRIVSMTTAFCIAILLLLRPSIEHDEESSHVESIALSSEIETDVPKVEAVTHLIVGDSNVKVIQQQNNFLIASEKDSISPPKEVKESELQLAHNGSNTSSNRDFVSETSPIIKVRKTVFFYPFIGTMHSARTSIDPTVLSSHSPYIASSDILNTSHTPPLSFGLNVGIEVVPGLSVMTGSGLTCFRSKFYNTEQMLSQKAYYINIPLRLDWTFWESGPVSMWFGVGGKVERLVYCKRGRDRVKDGAFHWSVVGDAGLQYALTQNIGLFIDQEVSYYFKPSNPAVQTYRTDNPLMLALEIGLRFNFSK